MLLDVLQEATSDEIQAYRKTVRGLFEESDRLDRKAVESGGDSLVRFQRSLADELTVLQSRGELPKGEELFRLVQSRSQDWGRSLRDEQKKRVPAAYLIGDKVATEGLGAAGYKLQMDPLSQSSLDAAASHLDEVWSGRAARFAQDAAMKLIRMHTLGGRAWSDVDKQLRSDPRRGQSYWFSSLRATETACRTWQADAQSQGNLRRLEEISDRTRGAVRMMYVLMDSKAGCKSCPPHNGKVYDVRGGKAP